ncbi:hypothetical protein C0J52_04234 [Blattella germanica]|nr:hypothetical protein C0J52_04234 [Blattella germanica]
MDDPAVELDLSKENVQPLRRGRMVNQLENALRAQYDETAHHELLKQKDEYELRLRTYEGDDPLEIWYEYVLWVEQSFIRDARKGNLSTILENCLKLFRDDERYHQDTRYIDLWLKHIQISVAPLEIYKKCIAHGIGKYNALFYVAWAHDLENTEDVKRADQVLLEGIKNFAQPLDQLEKARESQDEDDISDTAEFKVSGKHHLPNVPRRDIIVKENTLKPGPWTEKPRKKATVPAPVPVVRRPQQPSFQLHEDEEEEDDKQIVKTPTVYAGGSEYSFEELRAIEYNKGNTLKRSAK